MTHAEMRQWLRRRAHELADVHFEWNSTYRKNNFADADAVNRMHGASKTIALFSQICAESEIGGESPLSQLRYFATCRRENELGDAIQTAHIKNAIAVLEGAA